MSCNESIAGAFRRLREACNTAQGTQRFHGGVAPGQDFMGIALMAYIEYQPVHFRAKDPMDSYNDLNRTQTGGQMPPCSRYSVNKSGAQQFTQRNCLAVAQITQVVRNMIQIQNDITPRPVSGRTFYNQE